MTQSGKNPGSNYYYFKCICQAFKHGVKNLLEIISLPGFTVQLDDASSESHNEKRTGWTSPTEWYKGSPDCKGINSGQNGVRMIASSRWAAFGVERQSPLPVCTRTPPEPVELP